MVECTIHNFWARTFCRKFRASGQRSKDNGLSGRGCKRPWRTVNAFAGLSHRGAEGLLEVANVQVQMLAMRRVQCSITILVIRITCAC